MNHAAASLPINSRATTGSSNRPGDRFVAGFLSRTLSAEMQAPGCERVFRNVVLLDTAIKALRFGDDEPLQRTCSGHAGRAATPYWRGGWWDF